MRERRPTWLVDSRARCYICINRAVFTTLTKKEMTVDVSIKDGYSSSAKYEGPDDGHFKTDFGTYHLTIRQELYIPTARFDLISVTQAAVSNY